MTTSQNIFENFLTQSIMTADNTEVTLRY